MTTDSVSKQIIKTLIANLDTGASRPEELNILGRSPKVPFQNDSLPQISLYELEEDPTPTGDPRRPALIQRNLIVEMAITARGSRTESSEDAIDRYRQWVVSTMVQDTRVGGLAKSITEVKTRWAPDEGSDGDKVTLLLNYRIEYFTKPGDITQAIPR